jgi:hypothetical protein
MSTPGPTQTAPADPNEPGKKLTGGRFAAATLLVLAVTATFAPFLAAAVLGVAMEWSRLVSTGGLVALIASIVMGVKCRSWASWWKWIWLPVGLTVAIAFVAVSLMVSGARAEETARHAAECASWADQAASLTQRHDDLVAEINAIPGVWQHWDPPSEPPALHGATDWSAYNGGPSQMDLYEYYVAHDGPAIKEQAAQLQIRYEESCSEIGNLHD